MNMENEKHLKIQKNEEWTKKEKNEKIKKKDKKMEEKKKEKKEKRAQRGTPTTRDGPKIDFSQKNCQEQS